MWGYQRRLNRDLARWQEQGWVSAPNAERILPSMEVLPPGPDGEIVALIRRIPSARKQYAIDFLRMMAGEDTPQS